MKIFKRKNIIDELKLENEKLEVEKRKLKEQGDNKAREIGQKIEVFNIQIAELNDESLRQATITANKIAEIDRIISKNKKQMKLEKEYYDELVDAPMEKPMCQNKKRVD